VEGETGCFDVTEARLHDILAAVRAEGHLCDEEVGDPVNAILRRIAALMEEA